MEFTEIMGHIKTIMDSPQMQQQLRFRECYSYSWDNDRVHKGADLSTVGITADLRFELPELSSDMHKVVEHVHGWLQKQMQKWLGEHEGSPLTADQCKEKLQQLFQEDLNISSIQKNVRSLKATYQAVIDAGGGYIPARYR